MTALPRLMLIADRAAARGRPLAALVRAVSEALGGDLFVQLREKDLSAPELLALAQDLCAALGEGALLSINDRPAAARALGLGLHLPAAAARPRRAPRPLGRSVHDAAEAATAVADAVDYAVAGTIFPTASKPGRRGGGLAHLRALAAALDPIPAYAIGGIGPGNAGAAVAAGAWGVAVRTGILAADDPARAARAIADSLQA